MSSNENSQVRKQLKRMKVNKIISKSNSVLNDDFNIRFGFLNLSKLQLSVINFFLQKGFQRNYVGHFSFFAEEIKWREWQILKMVLHSDYL